MALTFAGIYISTLLKKRSEYLEKTVLLIECLILEIEYSSETLYEIIKCFSLRNEFKCLDYLLNCNSLIEEGVEYPNAWSDSVSKSKFFNKNEKEKMLQLGRILGSSNMQTQKRKMKIYLEYFNNFLFVSKKAEEKYASVFLYSGTLLGFGLFIIII